MALRLKITVVLIAVVVAFAAAFFFTSSYYTTQSITATLEKGQLINRDIASSHISAKIELLSTKAGLVAKSLMAAPSEAEWPVMMMSLSEEFSDFTAFAVFTREGVKASFGDSPATDFVLDGSRYLSDAFNGNSVISTIYNDPLTDRQVFYVCVPMGEGLVLAATIPGSFFSDILSEYKQWEKGGLFIVDGDGSLIAQSNPDLTDVNQPAGKYVTCENKRVSSPAVDWAVGAVTPIDESPLPGITRIFILMAVVFLIVGSVAAYYLSDSIARRRGVAGRKPRDVDIDTIRRAVSDRRSNIDRRSLGLGVAGLNTKKGIAFLGGDEDSYIGVLRSYTAATPPLLEKLKDVGENGLLDYAVITHGIGVSSRSIGADEFADISEAMEKAARAADISYVIKHNPAFLAAAWKLVMEIGEMLSNIYIGAPKPKRARPDPETIRRLLEACRNYDMDGVDWAIDELELYEYETDQELIDWIWESAAAMNFAQIVEMLADYS